MANALAVAQLQPLPGYVLVQPAEAQKQTSSGIILPGSNEEKPQHGVVLAVGGAVTEDGTEKKCPVKVKDHVFYKKWGANEVKIDDVEYQFLKFEDLLAVVSSKAK
jgi:chaperonin GroES